MVTIQYILEHPEEFDKDAQVIVVPRNLNPPSNNKTCAKEKTRRPSRMKQLFSLFPPVGSGFSMDFYERFKQVAKLNREGYNIYGDKEEIWFLTSSQEVLNRINKTFCTQYDFDKTHNSFLNSNLYKGTYRF